MTQPAPTSTNGKPLQSRAVGLHRQGDQWRLAVLGTGGDRPRIIETLSVPAADPAALDQALTRLKPEVLVGVIPSSQTVWRSVDAPPPAGSSAEAQGALSLLAEAHAPTGTPAHRRGAGLLRLGAELDAMASVAWTGELTGWPAELVEAVGQWAPEPAALAWLAAATGRAPGTLHVYADRSSGSIALVAGVPADHDKVPESLPKAVCRVLREDGSEPEYWCETVAAISGEVGDASALAVDHIQPDVTRPCAVMLGPTTGTSPGQGFLADRTWLDQYGIAAGAAAMALWHDPLSEPLLSMRAAAPTERRSILVSTVEWLAKPSRAYPVMALCVLAVILWPLGVAYSRWSVLKSAAGEAAKTQSDYKRAAEEADFYQALADRRIPMTKMLAELTANAPPGIIIETLSIDQRKVTVRGTTESGDLVSEWRSTLGNSRIFEDVRTPVIEAGASPIKFDLEAVIGQPLLAYAGVTTGSVPSDTGKRESSRPLISENDRPAPPPRSADGARKSDQPSNGGNTRTNRTRDNNRTGAKGDSGKSATGAKSEPAAIPEPISDAQIAALDRAGAMREWAARRRASLTPGIDDATRSRLVDEAAKAQQRMQSLPSGEGGGS